MGINAHDLDLFEKIMNQHHDICQKIANILSMFFCDLYKQQQLI